MAFLGVGAAVAGAFFGGSAIVAGVVDFGVTIATSIGISYAAQALAPKPATPEAAHFSTQGTIQSSGAVPRSFLLGNTFTAGSLVYHNTWGTSDDGKSPNAYYTKVIRLADTPIQALTGVWIGGVKCNLTTDAPANGSNNSALMGEALAACFVAGFFPFQEAGVAFIANYLADHGVSDGAGGVLDDKGVPVLEYRKADDNGVMKDHVWIKFYDGTQTTADSFLTTKVSSVDRPYETTRVGVGIPYAIATSLVEDTLFSGFPDYKFEVTGIKLYDPTKDDTNGGTGSHRFSDPTTWGGDGDHLPAVQAYNILRGIRYNGKWLYGLQLTTQANLPSVNWNAQIAKCRATIAGVGGDEPTYRSAGQITVDSPPADALDAFMTACQGKISEVGGYYKVHLGAPDSPTFTFTDDDLLSTDVQTFDPFLPLSDSINGITATYPDPTQAWNTVSAPALYNADFEAEDGSRRLLASPAFDLVPYAAQVQRLMQSALNAARRERKHQLPFPPSFWAMEPGDLLEWTSTRNGYVAKLFEVTGIVDQANLDITASLQEVDPTDYSWDHDTDYTAPTFGPTTYPRPAAQGILAWGATGYTLIDQNGYTRRPAIQLVWDGDVPGCVGVQYELAHQDPSSGNWITIDRNRTDQIAAGALIIWNGLLANEPYRVRGQYIPSAPRDMLWSDWIDVTTPDAQTSLADFDDGLQNQVTTLRQQIIDTAQATSDLIDSVAAEVNAQSYMNKTALRAEAYANKVVLQNQIQSVSDTASAAIQQVQTVATSAIAALSSEIDTLTATVGNNTSSIETNATAISTLSESFASYQTTVSAQFGNNTSSIETNATAISNLNASFASYQTTVSEQFGNNTSSIETNATAISNLNASFASYQTTVSAQFGSMQSSVTANSTAVATINGQLAASYSLMVDTNGYWVGYKITNSGIGTGTVIFRTDNFQIGLPGVGSKTPFSIGTINGALTVGMSADAILLDASVTARQMSIGSLSAITANLGTVTAGQLNSTNGKWVQDLNGGTLIISD